MSLETGEGRRIDRPILRKSWFSCNEVGKYHVMLQASPILSNDGKKLGMGIKAEVSLQKEKALPPA